MKIAVVRCSDVRSEKEKPEIEKLCGFLSENGAQPAVGDNLYVSADGRERAQELMRFYREGYDLILDVSGGNSCEELLPYMDFDLVAASGAVLWGYSDLTVMLNAVYAATGKSSVLWQARNIIRDGSGRAAKLFTKILGGDKRLFSPEIKMLRGDSVHGTLIGGNLRCFLKLYGTPYFPKPDGCVILAEALSGDARRLCSSFDRLADTGALEGAAGLILGTFTEADRLGEDDTVVRYIMSKTGIPVARTSQIGHAPSSMAALIGEKIIL